MSARFQWLHPDDSGLYCRPGGFHVDPHRPVARAMITHGHADHARAGHGAVLATQETLAIMAARYGPDFAGETQALGYGERLTVGDATVWLAPAGHVLGSAQAAVEHGGERAVISGDYARRENPTCAPFEPVACDLFVTEATFGLPVFRHPDPDAEIAKLLRSLELFPERAHLVGVYALGKAQRVMALLRRAGYDAPIPVHGALIELSELYRRIGVELGPLEPIDAAAKKAWAGRVVLCPPGALADRWSRGFPEPISALASGWMLIRQRAKQRRVELPLVISDHADWGELTATIRETGADTVWVTHGQEDALVHYARSIGLDAAPLSLQGREEQDSEGAAA